MSRGKPMAPKLRLFVDGSDDHPRWQIKIQAARDRIGRLLENSDERVARALARLRRASGAGQSKKGARRG